MDRSRAPFHRKQPPDYARMTHGFEKVVIPLRLGEYQLLNDGLVGFWKETATASSITCLPRAADAQGRQY